jgi:flagellar hook-basal body complex protein FliE
MISQATAYAAAMTPSSAASAAKVSLPAMSRPDRVAVRAESAGTPQPFAPARPEAPEGPSSFESILGAVEGVNGDQLKADDALASFAAGENVDLHGTFIALEKADISLRAMVSVRDRALAAYEQIMNMSI